MPLRLLSFFISHIHKCFFSSKFLDRGPQCYIFPPGDKISTCNQHMRTRRQSCVHTHGLVQAFADCAKRKKIQSCLNKLCHSLVAKNFPSPSFCEHLCNREPQWITAYNSLQVLTFRCYSVKARNDLCGSTLIFGLKLSNWKLSKKKLLQFMWCYFTVIRVKEEERTASNDVILVSQASSLPFRTAPSCF